MKVLDDSKWLRDNFSFLVKKYGGQYVLIAHNKVFPVTESNVAEVEKQLKQKYKIRPIGTPVPRKEDLLSVLICIP